MATRVLCFPPVPTASLHIRPVRLSRGPAALPQTPMADGQSLGPRLVYSRPERRSKLKSPAGLQACTQAQAHRVASQIDGELAGRAHREDSARRGFDRLPPQSTQVGLRQRLLDALPFFGRPA